MSIFNSYLKTGRVLAAVSLMALSNSAIAAIESVNEAVVDLWAKQFQVDTPDGDSLRMWGFAIGDANGPTEEPQYPAPTLRAGEGETITVTVHNFDLPQAVTLNFPGNATVVRTSCTRHIGTAPPRPGSDGCFRNESRNVVTSGAGNTLSSIRYDVTLNEPGTYMYSSGVNPQVQVDMGMVGALIVDPVMTVSQIQPTDFHATGLAYNDAKSAYDREYLFVLSETDPKLHHMAELNLLDRWDNAAYKSTLFFINGRNAPDTLAPNMVPQLPHQPYGSIVLMHPGQRVLLRVLNVGRNQHPLHLHGNHFDQIARDGNLIGATTASGTELRPITDYTLGAVQGSTSDLIFNWTGERMGWDIFGTGAGFEHDCVDNENNITHATTPDGYDDTSWEFCEDHGKGLPVSLPENLDLAFGGFWGGSPFLGSDAALPVGEGGLNPGGGMVFMWHSHSERALTNNDIYPGGMLTMMIVLPRPATP